MADDMPPADEPTMRIADRDRDAVVDRLSRAMSEGRIDVSEFEARSRAAYEARVAADLVPLTADLPAAATDAALVSSGGPAAGRRRWLVAVFGDRRQARWNRGDRAVAISLFGDQVLDMTAQPDPGVDIVSVSVFGDLTLFVAPEVEVEVAGLTLFGDQRVDETSSATTGTPSVRMRRFALFGDTKVATGPEPERRGLLDRFR